MVSISADERIGKCDKIRLLAAIFYLFANQRSRCPVADRETNLNESLLGDLDRQIRTTASRKTAKSPIDDSAKSNIVIIYRQVTLTNNFVKS